jgi:hypothetical protein
MLSTAARADLGAHLLGLVCGGTVGVGTALVLRGAPGRSLQVVLAFGTAAAFAAAWAAALRGGEPTPERFPYSDRM